jgi:uncharacterized protein YndB with AHSA1/START domain
MRELFAVVPLVAGFARIQLFMHVFQFENSGWPGLERTREARFSYRNVNVTGAWKNSMQMDFIVDKETKTVSITKEFAFELDLVWDAYTKPELLDQWWAPKPWMSRTKAMDFKVGGRRFYAMVSPEGVERWSVQKYTSITPKTNFKLFNAFADKDENLELPGSDWDLNFSEQDGKTTVSISIYNESLERLEKMIEMGFKEGFTMTLGSLKELLAKLSQQKGTKQ